MAPTTRSETSHKDHVDPVLAKLAETATFDCDWPTLRHHLYLSVLAVLPLFLELGPPQPPRRPSNVLREGEPNEDLRPSTHGGLVIPPFPPLDPNRRRQTSLSPGPSVITADRMNGTPNHPPRNSFDEEPDPDVVIGGKKLAGWMDEEEGRREVEKMAGRIEDLSFPPFTLQRLAELLTYPTSMHRTLGKFLRAIDKMLSVTTPYAAPSYTYVPPPHLPLEGLGASPSSSPAMSPLSANSTVPPGSMTPLFSPIPFLIGGEDALGDPMEEEEALMSPLALGSTFGGQGGRSPAPEPEGEVPAMDLEREEARVSEESSAAGSGVESLEGDGEDAGGTRESDPGHQPYLGRVDELDSGPLTSNGHAEETEGLGEAGNMTPHGMSQRPVALSRTTTIEEAEREIAPLPRRESVSARSGSEEREEE